MNPMTDQPVKPAADSLPPEILKRREAINLYFLAVGALALIAVLAVLGGLLLAWAGKQAPGEIWAFAGIAVGGLVALVSGDRQGAQ